MRAARLLHCLLILQNRGRQTARSLADELEVSTRTILRDVDAMTEAGLPIIVHRGNQGGIELGFDYRTRLTGLSADEAEALGLFLAQPMTRADTLGLGAAARMALAKISESLPDRIREKTLAARDRYPQTTPPTEEDPRLPALAEAIRTGRMVRLDMRSAHPVSLTPTTLGHDGTDWWISDKSGEKYLRTAWGHINISRRRQPQDLGDR